MMNLKIYPLQFYPLKIAGTMGASYAVGDYPQSNSYAATHAVEDGGIFAFDTFRMDLEYQ